MNKIIQKGTASLIFETPVYIESTASVAGKKEGEGPLGAFIDRIFSDPMFGQDTWEAAESAMQGCPLLISAWYLPEIFSLRLPPPLSARPNWGFPITDFTAPVPQWENPFPWAR